jgi:hypothetical protein
VDIQEKLQNLKELHDKGLITTSVYEEQQKNLLTEGVKTEPPSSPTQPSSFLDPKKNLSALVKGAALVVIVLGGIWLVFRTSGQEGKDAVSQFASQTGIGTQVIPWSDRAETAARKLVDLNKQGLASAIQGITHASGGHPALARYSISKSPDQIRVELVIEWKGGLLGGDYATTVAWDIGQSHYISAAVIADSAPVGISARDKTALDDYFRMKVYPAFYSDMGG